MRLKQALHDGDLAGVHQAIRADPASARHPQFMLAAAGRAFLAAVRLLHKNGGDLNSAWRNYRPLHALMQTDPHAAGGKPEPERIACFEWLLKNGADPEQMGAWPAARAIIIAAFVGEPEYVARLKQAGARMDGFVAAALGDREEVAATLSTRAAFASERDGGLLTALQCAAGSRLPKAKTIDTATMLLDAGADPNAKTRTWGHDVDAAYFVAGTGRSDMWTLLLDRGANATEALTHAVWRKRYALADVALAHGAQPDRAVANGKPLLNDLIRWGQIPQTKWLLSRGASPSVRDGDGWTAAHQAASRGNAQLLRAVIDAGADLTIRDEQQNTPLDIARLLKRGKLVTLLAGE